MYYLYIASNGVFTAIKLYCYPVCSEVVGRKEAMEMALTTKGMKKRLEGWTRAIWPIQYLFDPKKGKVTEAEADRVISVLRARGVSTFREVDEGVWTASGMPQEVLIAIAHGASDDPDNPWHTIVKNYEARFGITF